MTAHSGGGFLGLNGKSGEILRWLLMLALSGMVAYYTSMNAMSQQIAVTQTTERAHFDEMQRTLADMKDETRRSLADIKADVREIRATVKR